MTPNEAAKLLGLTLPTTEEAVRQAFARRILDTHPDSAKPEDVTPFQHSVSDVKKARDILLQWTRGVKPPCRVCGGDGEVLARGFKAVPCPKGCKKPKVERVTTRRK